MERCEEHCVFCNIWEGTEPATVYYKDEQYMAFADIKQASDFHILVIPKEHIQHAKSLLVHGEHACQIVQDLVRIGTLVLKQLKGDLTECSTGFHWPPFYTVPHLHLHVLAPASKIKKEYRREFAKKSFFFVSPTDVIKWVNKNANPSTVNSANHSTRH